MKNLILFLSAFLVSGMVYGQNHTTNYGNNSGTNGDLCSFFGVNAGKVNGTDADYCSFFGVNAGYKNKTGKSNSFFGAYSGLENEAGLHNCYMGTNAGRANRNGSYNTYIGTNAGLQNTGSNNVFLGYNAGRNKIGNNKLHIANRKDKSLIYGDFAQEYVGIAIDPSQDIASPDSYALYVGKGVMCEKVRVAIKPSSNGGSNPDWSDYVFEADYKRNSLEEVDDFVKKNKHLPNVPSAAEVYKNGIDLGQMDATLLRQIEELWLHMIDMKKENDVLKEEIKNLKEQSK